MAQSFRILYAAFIVVCQLYSLAAECQPTDIDVLKKFAASDEFCKYIIPCADCKEVVLVDTAGVFKIDSFHVAGRSFIIKPTGHPLRMSPNTHEELLLRVCNNVLITKYLRRGRKVRLHYFHYPTNGIGWASFKRKKCSVKMTGFSYGQL